jgi:CDP-glucose 4,6-dehydratase
LIPDAVRAWESGLPLSIRRPAAIRPWQHVLEPLAGYLALVRQMWDHADLAGAYNFGPATNAAASVRNVVELARATYGQGDVVWGDGNEGPHEAGWLALEVSKARVSLDVAPRWDLPATVARTMNWYRKLAQGVEARTLCRDDIDAYEAVE